MPAPCGVQKLDLWAAKYLLLSFPFTLVSLSAAEWVMGLSLWRLSTLPWGQSWTSSHVRGTFWVQGRTPGWWSDPYVFCTGTLNHRAHDAWQRKPSPGGQICLPYWFCRGLWDLVSSQQVTGAPSGEKRASHHSAWLCWIITISCASGNSLLPKSLQKWLKELKGLHCNQLGITAIW